MKMSQEVALIIAGFLAVFAILAYSYTHTRTNFDACFDRCMNDIYGREQQCFMNCRTGQ